MSILTSSNIQTFLILYIELLWIFKKWVIISRWQRYKVMDQEKWHAGSALAPALCVIKSCITYCWSTCTTFQCAARAQLGMTVQCPGKTEGVVKGVEWHHWDPSPPSSARNYECPRWQSVSPCALAPGRTAWSCWPRAGPSSSDGMLCSRGEFSFNFSGQNKVLKANLIS